VEVEQMHNATQTLGRMGEDEAARFLVGLGWVLLERNWRCREGEADIIARDPDVDALVVVEVKTRAGTGYGSPLDAITFEKARRLRWLAAIYARQSGTRARRLRVDAIGILWPRGQALRLTHVRGIEQR